MKANNSIPYGLNEAYWNSLSSEMQALYLRVAPHPTSAYTVDWPLGSIEKLLSEIESGVLHAGGSFELVPDFQRGHVWTDAQRCAYVEALIRKSTSGRVLFNCPGWVSTPGEGDIPEQTFQCIDGLQRLTAVRMFMADEITVFDGLRATDLKGSPFDPSRPSYCLQIGIYEFTRRKDLLQFYLRLNAGGTVHSAEEIARVRGLLEQAQASGA